MCGIVAILSRRPRRDAPDLQELLATLDGAVAAAGGADGDPVPALAPVAELLEGVDRALRGVPGVWALVAHPEADVAIRARLDLLDERAAAAEAALEAVAGAPTAAALEAANAALVRLRDVLWALRQDRLRTARAVADLAGPHAGPAALAGLTAVQQALSSLDRLEVRGRDSAGLHLLVAGHGLDLESEHVRHLLAVRTHDPLFTSGSVRVAGDVLSFVYKAAAEIGELGDNTRALRDAMRGDQLLHLALAAPTARVSVLGHTRWASVGIISEPNAHPLNHEEEGDEGTGPYVVASLNGDVDNHADLKAAHGLRIAAPITTDAKVIPALVSRHARGGDDLTEAFRRTGASFDGSVAIGAAAGTAPDALWLALRGSGQGVYVGLSEDAYIVASEPYGVVEETRCYLRMDGETPARAGEAATRGQVLVLDATRAGTVEGIRRLAYDGTELPVSERDLAYAEVTTRDIDRGPNPHFLLKEITEAPSSFRKTLRGRIREADGQLSAALGERALPPFVAERLPPGQIHGGSAL